jgi:hypothetical protein
MIGRCRIDEDFGRRGRRGDRDDRDDRNRDDDRNDFLGDEFAPQS